MALRLALVCLSAALVATVNGGQCYREFGGVCISMTMGYCPFTSGTFSWLGCAGGEICCIPKREEPEPTSPPAQREECGVRQVGDDGSFRIVGGQNATLGAWPWVVSLEYSEKEDPHLCGAALINDRWLVTASHCFMESRNPGHYRAVVGQHDRDERLEHEQVIPAEIVLMHEDFNNPYKANDIALVRLARPVKFGDFAQPVCLPSAGESYEGEVCTVVGWGVPDAYSTDQLRILQEVNVPILRSDRCDARVFPFHRGSNICAGYKYGGKDACGGDSGGPLMCQRVGSNQWRLVGVISWGNGCARPESPGVYTHVTHYLDWIRGMTEE